MKHKLLQACIVFVVSFITFAYAKNKRPNILFIMSDDHTSQAWGIYGGILKDYVKTSNIQRLANEGCVLENAFCTNSICTPSRASILTGQYSHINQVYTLREPLLPDHINIAGLLKKNGYQTALIGKWHLGLEEPNTPNGRGFDYFKGFLCDMIDDYYKHRRHGINYFRENRKVIDPPGHATDLITKWGVDYVNDRKGKDNPFFMYLAYNAPHTPIQPPQDWFEKVKTREPGISDKRAKLVALIEHMDHGIGQVIETLKRNSQYENTLTIFTSDNGGQVSVAGTNGNHRGGKQDMYEGGLKVPTCAVWPGKIKAGTSSNLVGITMDLYPTACAAAGARVPDYVEGKSILPTMLGETQNFDRDLVFVRREGACATTGRITMPFVGATGNSFTTPLSSRTNCMI